MPEGKFSFSIILFFDMLKKSVIVGLTQYTNKCHLARAVLEAVCFQTKEVLDAMKKDSGVSLNKLKVDGGMTKSELVLQIQADLIGIPVGEKSFKIRIYLNL